MSRKKRFFWGLIYSIAALSGGSAALASGPLSIDTCYTRARMNFPLIRQRTLTEKSRDYNISNALRGYLPQLSVNGQLTNQSAVTSIPFSIPLPHGENLSFPVIPLTQYNVHAEVDQVIYDGGSILGQKELAIAGANVQEQNTEVQLYAIKDRINQLFFGILLITEQLKLDAVNEKDIQNSIDKMKESVSQGTALVSSLRELEAKLLQQQQTRIDLESNRKAYLDMLGLFINSSLDESTVLQTPGTPVLNDSIRRPELDLYNYQKKNDDVQLKIINANNLPKLSFFLQGGYALPGLNMFDVNAATYYMGGLRLNWTLGGLYTMKNQKQLLAVDKQSIDIQKETFLFNTHQTLKQQNADISKLQLMVLKDTEIIVKLTEVKNSAKAQMENGIITTHEYIAELDLEDQAKQNLLIHQVQLMMDQYNQKNTTGNY